MFERFTPSAIKAIMLAQVEARLLGHNFVGTEQILLGLFSERTGIAAEALKAVGFTHKEGRAEVEKIIGRGSGFVAIEIPFTPKAKRLLVCACDEADKLGSKDVNTEHVLLGLIREADESLQGGKHGVAFRVLENLGIDLNVLRTKVFDLLKPKT